MTGRQAPSPRLGLAALLLLALGGPGTAVTAQPAGHDPHQHHSPGPAPPPETPAEEGLRIPDVRLVDQEGREVRFHSDLIAGKVVAMNFVFTTCTTICRPMGAIFAKLQRELGDRAGRDVHLVSVSIDPVTDTPERLKAWAESLGAGPGWTLLTGAKTDVDNLLKALGVFTPDYTDHAPTVLIGNARAGSWKRTYGLAPPSKLTELIDEVTAFDAGAASDERAEQIARAREYFTDVELVNQHGEKMRLYSDLLHGKTVVISPFFTTCTGVCPVLNQKLAAIQRHLGERLGSEAHLISISVDPVTDTPDKLAAYAERFGAKPGWYFLSGEKENVDWALYKLGQYVEDKEAHTNVMIVGNETTGQWRKVFGLSPAEELVRIVEEVLNDDG